MRGEDARNGWNGCLFSVGRGTLVEGNMYCLGGLGQARCCRVICIARGWFRSMKWRE